MSETKQFVAKHRFAGITARKARYIADLIRGRSVNEALEMLQFAPQRGASFYLKVVRSAVANASMDENININRLFISECRADDGPLLNGRMRFRPGPQGRATCPRKGDRTNERAAIAAGPALTFPDNNPSVVTSAMPR